MPRVTLQPEGSGTPLTIEIDGEPGTEGLTGFTLQLGEQSLTGHGRLGPDGEGFLRIGEQVLPFYAVRTGGSGREPGRLHLWLGGEIYVFEAGERREARGERRQAGALPPSGAVLSPMPGIVLQVLARTGESVSAGTPLVILESMKMELTVPAPADAEVIELLCEPGQRVDRDAVLVRLKMRGEC